MCRGRPAAGAWARSAGPAHTGCGPPATAAARLPARAGALAGSTYREQQPPKRSRRLSALLRRKRLGRPGRRGAQGARPVLRHLRGAAPRRGGANEGLGSPVDADAGELATRPMAALQGGHLLAQTAQGVKPMRIALDVAIGHIEAWAVPAAVRGEGALRGPVAVPTGGFVAVSVSSGHHCPRTGGGSPARCARREDAFVHMSGDRPNTKVAATCKGGAPSHSRSGRFSPVNWSDLRYV